MSVFEASAALRKRWRIALNHAWLDRDGKPTFHAYDEQDFAICAPMWNLVLSNEAPNEGCYFCPDCLQLTETN